MNHQAEQVVVMGETQAFTLGDELRRRRESLGIDLNEIAEATCIGVRFLRAIEENDFNALPGGLFTRSFIRSFARYIDMDENHALKLYHEQSGETDPSDYGLTTTPPTINPASSTWINIIITFAILVVLALAGLAGWHYWKRMHTTSQATTEKSSMIDPAETSSAQPLPVLPASSSQPTPPINSSASRGEQLTKEVGTAEPETPENSHQPALISLPARSGSEISPLPPTTQDIPTPAQLDLSIRAFGASHVVVQADTQMARGETLQAGERRVFHATERIAIYNADSSQLMLTINGRQIQLPHTITPNEPVIITRQTLTKFVKRQ